MFKHDRREADLDAEIRAHLAMETQRRIDSGESPESARNAALKDLGSPALVKEYTRETWGWSALSAFTADLRFGLRLLRKNPGLTATVIFSLAIGIGATTSVFGLVNSTMLRPLASPNAGRLVVVWPIKDAKRWILFYPVFSEIRAAQSVFRADQIRRDWRNPIPPCRLWICGAREPGGAVVQHEAWRRRTA